MIAAIVAEPNAALPAVVVSLTAMYTSTPPDGDCLGSTTIRRTAQRTWRSGEFIGNRLPLPSTFVVLSSSVQVGLHRESG